MSRRDNRTVMTANQVTEERGREEKVWTGHGGGVTAEADVLISEGQRSPGAHQCLSGEHLQQGDEVVSISEVLVQVGDVSLGLRTEERGHSVKHVGDMLLIHAVSHQVSILYK